jgi:acetamidase/formamidase
MATHHFAPAHYFTTMGAHPPVLRVRDGDTIVTTTVDASGRDARLEQVTERGNPMTGPFFVEGAEAGDTLVVELERLVPNRRAGWSGAVLAPSVLDPHTVWDLPRQDDGAWIRADWDVDLADGTATLVRPETRLGQLRLPLAPMLGCFGVAPAQGQAISTATSGPHGGNMDYRGFVSGVTVYFPVAAPGALLFVGDGHALQGDGEIAGTGVEISFEVQLTVRVQKGRRIAWPRGENADYIFTVGNARPLDQCVQHATSEMLRWLQEDYRIGPLEANLLMGQCVRYDLGNVFDPAYTMVCKMPKSVLPPRQPG